MQRGTISPLQGFRFFGNSYNIAKDSANELIATRTV